MTEKIPNRVTVSAGFTKQLNQFEPLRLDFEIESNVLESETTAEAVDRVYALLEDRLVTHLDRLLKEVRLVANGNG